MSNDWKILAIFLLAMAIGAVWQHDDGKSCKKCKSHHLRKNGYEDRYTCLDCDYKNWDPNWRDRI